MQDRTANGQEASVRQSLPSRPVELPAFAGQKILIANHQFSGFTGSEIHCLQLAEFFISHGATVSFLGLRADEPMVSEIRAIGADLVGMWSLVIPSRRNFDLIWSHHETTFLHLHVFHGLRAKLHLHGLLSVLIKLERMPLSPDCETSGSLVFLANSVETQKHIMATSGRTDIKVLRNIVPDAFFKTPKKTYSTSVQRVAIVSNHVPEDVMEAVEILKQDGIEVVIFGEGHTYRKIDRTSLVDFDVVITIGKTAQYCIAQGVPLFLYDHFGGPGYLTVDSLEHHERFNFSGRSEPTRLPADKLVSRLLSHYGPAVKTAQALRHDAPQRYSIGHQHAPVLAGMADLPSSALDRRARRRTFFSICDGVSAR